MSTSATAGDRDLRTLADIVSADRSDLPAGEGLPPSLLADLMDQIRCDVISFEGFDSKRQETWLLQSIPGRGGAVVEDLDPVHWSTTGTASRAAIRTGPATCAASSRSQTSTRPGNGIASAPAAASTGRWGSNTI